MELFKNICIYIMPSENFDLVGFRWSQASNLQKAPKAILIYSHTILIFMLIIRIVLFSLELHPEVQTHKINCLLGLSIWRSQIKVNIICPKPLPAIPISVNTNIFHLSVIQTRNHDIIIDSPLPYSNSHFITKSCRFCLLNIFWIFLLWCQ